MDLEKGMEPEPEPESELVSEPELVSESESELVQGLVFLSPGCRLFHQVG